MDLVALADASRLLIFVTVFIAAMRAGSRLTALAALLGAMSAVALTFNEREVFSVLGTAFALGFAVVGLRLCEYERALRRLGEKVLTQNSHERTTA